MAEESKSPFGDMVIGLMMDHEQRLREATAKDLELAALLMQAAFVGRPQPQGIASLYLEQACAIMRNPELRRKIVVAVFDGGA